ncbi:MAG: tripartite tricarboxylate transporter substrate-binding protein [Actinomycetota bacterium]|nr:hypothetical protein [Actinomycetota bacterium]
MAGRTAFAMFPISLALPHIRAGSLIALGVTTARSSRLLPDVTTIAKAGVVGFDFPIWYGIWAPAGTPGELVHKLSNDIGRALAEPGLRDRLAEHDGDLMGMTQADFARFVLSESESAARITKDRLRVSAGTGI